ncbi:unnamed protein product, partial [Effrenium voratum]
LVPKLQTLILADNQFATADFPPAAFRQLAASCPQLTELDLHGSFLGREPGLLGALAVELPQTLRVLHLGAALLQGENLEVFLSSLQLPLLERLSLVQARLDDSSLQLLGNWFTRSPLPRLQFLNISGNCVS